MQQQCPAMRQLEFPDSGHCSRLGPCYRKPLSPHACLVMQTVVRRSTPQHGATLHCLPSSAWLTSLTMSVPCRWALSTGNLQSQQGRCRMASGRRPATRRGLRLDLRTAVESRQAPTAGTWTRCLLRERYAPIIRTEKIRNRLAMA